MLRPLQVQLEFPRDCDAERDILSIARDFGLTDMVGWHTSNFGTTTFRFRVSRGRSRVEKLADDLERYFVETGASIYGCSVYVHPPKLRASVVVGNLLDWFSRLWWALRQPHDPERDHNLYILKWEASSALQALAPFRRCRDCKGFTRILWHRRDPHFRNGRWIGPDDCLPF